MAAAMTVRDMAYAKALAVYDKTAEAKKNKGT